MRLWNIWGVNYNGMEIIFSNCSFAFSVRIGSKMTKKKWWVCTSASKSPYPDCKRPCKVNVSFEPRGCLYSAVWQNWEEIKEEDDKKEMQMLWKRI